MVEVGFNEFHKKYWGWPARLNKAAFTLIAIGTLIGTKGANGQTMRGRVINIDATVVTLDFNHPYAGKILYFAVEIIQVS